MKHSHTVTYEVLDHYDSLEENDRLLVAEAYAAAEKAYAPYSKFQVGAALRLDDQQIISGSNQENMAYPSGLCAERVAIFYAGASFPDKNIETLVVVANGDLIAEDECVSPCGSCRQVMAESEMRQKSSFRLILVAQSGKTVIFDRSTDMLLFPFGTRDYE